MKRVLIVGATSAIAQACARQWASEGNRLFLVARDGQKLEALRADLVLRGAEGVHVWQLDATNVPAHGEMLQAGMGALGALDVVLVAHGTLPNQLACQESPEVALKEWMTNAGSTMVLLQAFGNAMERQGHGALAVITSVAGDRGRPSNYVYGSAKAAVSTFCEGLRPRLFRSGVSLTDVRPGFVESPMTAGLPLPSLLVAAPSGIAPRIVAGIERGTDVLYVPAFWALVMLVIRNIPRVIFKRLHL